MVLLDIEHLHHAKGARVSEPPLLCSHSAGVTVLVYLEYIF